MPKKETKTLAILFLIIDIISIGAFVFLFTYTKNLITKAVNNEDEIKTELKKDNALVLMKDALVAGKLYQDKMLGYIVPSGGTVDFIKTVELLVSNSGLKSDIKTVVSGPYDKGNIVGAELLRVSMDVVGEWKNIQFLITSLENYPLKINITKVSLNKFSDYIVNGKKVPEWAGSFEFTVVKMKDVK